MFLEIEEQLINVDHIERIWARSEDYPSQTCVLYFQMVSGDEVCFEFDDKQQVEWMYSLIKGALKQQGGVLAPERWVK